MKCPNCNVGDLRPLSDSISICGACGYVIEPRSWGIYEPKDVAPLNVEPDFIDRFAYAVQKLLSGFGL